MRIVGNSNDLKEGEFDALLVGSDGGKWVRFSLAIRGAMFELSIVEKERKERIIGYSRAKDQQVTFGPAESAKLAEMVREFGRDEVASMLSISVAQLSRLLSGKIKSVNWLLRKRVME